ncbi:MAG: hypothetical protein ACRDRH_03285 [Pseudonocardia sp.]
MRAISNGLRLPRLPLRPKMLDGKRRLIVLSRMEGWKRIDRCLSAFGRLPTELALRAQLDVHGEGSDLERLKLIATDLSWRLGLREFLPSCPALEGPRRSFSTD